MYERGKERESEVERDGKQLNSQALKANALHARSNTAAKQSSKNLPHTNTKLVKLKIKATYLLPASV